MYAARLMAPRKQGLIVVISSAGGLRYLFNVAYGVGKSAVSVGFPFVNLKKRSNLVRSYGS